MPIIARSAAAVLGALFGRVLVTPGPVNGITDIAGIEVGFTTLISGAGPLQAG